MSTVLFVGVRPDYFESVQLLRYRPGQYYSTHHDMSGQRKRFAGHRVYTVFLYLSDVEAGGATAFPDLGVEVRPERGAVLIWPSVRDDDPNVADMRTRHGALPVLAGTKYSANVWVHQGPFKLAVRRLGALELGRAHPPPRARLPRLTAGPLRPLGRAQHHMGCDQSPIMSKQLEKQITVAAAADDSEAAAGAGEREAHLEL